MKTYGTIRRSHDHKWWLITAEPQVAMRLKQVCSSVDKRAVGLMSVTNTPEHCRDLLWFIDRYPMEVDPLKALRAGAKEHVDHVQLLAQMIEGHTPPPNFPMALAPRPYQAMAAQVARHGGGLLVGDEVGLGKTCVGIATIVEPACLPALIVVPAHLLSQWAVELPKFAPHLKVFVTPGMTPESVQGADVVLTNYHRLPGWAEVLAEYCTSVVYDEVHELRREKTVKYRAASHLAKRTTVRLGLSATPIFNYGGEFYWVMNVLAPGRLGSREEFLREWCDYGGDKAKIRDPKAFGAYLRDAGLFMRRTRAEVGRELPPITTVVQAVDSDERALDAVRDEVRELARILLGQTGAAPTDRWKAGGELDWKLRQATGLAKAPAVASFVRLLVESGEKVVLFGWHHAVYDVWIDRLRGPADAVNPQEGGGLRVARYTGEESTAQKDAAAAAWKAGELDVLILSLRSGSGLDGLQMQGHIGVVGELDWSPAVLEQCGGRIWRDGQDQGVMMYYLVSEEGSDPVMAETLGIKRGQLDGVRRKDGDVISTVQGDGEHLKRLAAAYLNRAGVSASRVTIPDEAPI